MLLSGYRRAHPFYCLFQGADARCPGEELPQWRFAGQIRQQGGASLLNYGTLDGGFYTAAGLMPPCRYFCVTNLPLPEQRQQQDALLQSGGVDFVVSLDGQLAQRFAGYILIDRAEYDGGEGPITWYLYRRSA